MAVSAVFLRIHAKFVLYIKIYLSPLYYKNNALVTYQNTIYIYTLWFCPRHTATHSLAWEPDAGLFPEATLASCCPNPFPSVSYPVLWSSPSKPGFCSQTKPPGGNRRKHPSCYFIFFFHKSLGDAMRNWSFLERD